jgi:branched-chain amino acid transport system substrate-binding protein
MKAAANMKDLELDLLLPGIKVNTTPSDFYPIEQNQMMRFKGGKWEFFGPIISGEVRGS